MAGVSYFQRYSQKENHVTNNTLLVLRYLHDASPSKLQDVLRDLLDDNQILLGPSFAQQVKGAQSIPDALIEQKPFRVFFETKLSSDFNLAQLKQHIKGIGETQTPPIGALTLIGLAPTQMTAKQQLIISAFGQSLGVVFKSVSFSQLVEALRGVCADYDTSLRAIIDDYEDFLSVELLLDASDDLMLVFPCGTSIAENKEFGVYYDGTDRPSRRACRYLGCYRNKEVSLVGEIKAVLVCRYVNGHVEVVATERGESTDEQLERIRLIIERTTYYDLRSVDQRYYVVDRFTPTKLVKLSKGPVRGAQYLRLSSILSKDVPKALEANQLAELLKGKSFPTV